MILVAHASRHGSTTEVAHTIAAHLREAGFDVELREAAAVEAVGAYAGIVLGGSIYAGLWHREARRFLRRFGGELSRTPLAVYGMGPRTLSPDGVAGSRRQLERSLHGVDPAYVAIFGGVVDPGKLPFPFSRLEASDARDWEAIESFAEDVADAVRRNGPHTMRPCIAPS